MSTVMRQVLISFNVVFSNSHVSPMTQIYVHCKVSGIPKPNGFIKGFEHLTDGVAENIVTCLQSTHFPPCSPVDFLRNLTSPLHREPRLPNDIQSQTIRFSLSMHHSPHFCFVLICSELVVNLCNFVLYSQ